MYKWMTFYRFCMRVDARMRELSGKGIVDLPGEVYGCFNVDWERELHDQYRNQVCSTVDYVEGTIEMIADWLVSDLPPSDQDDKV